MSPPAKKKIKKKNWTLTGEMICFKSDHKISGGFKNKRPAVNDEVVNVLSCRDLYPGPEWGDSVIGLLK